MCFTCATYTDFESVTQLIQKKISKQVTEMGCVLVYRYTKEGNINELRHNSIYGYENKRNSLVYRYTRAGLFKAGLR